MLEVSEPNSTSICSSFLFDGKDVRIISKDENEFLFNASDVCRVLAYSNPWDAIKRHVDEDDLVKHEVVDSLQRKQKLNFVKEPGLYALIYGSKQKEARKFKKWINSVVLPSIRKTGGYQINQESNQSNNVKSVLETVKTSYQIAKPYHSMATLLGCSKSVANALTAKFVRQNTGMDTTILLENNISDVQDPLVTPTDIGRELGLSAAKSNLILEKLGLQCSVDYTSGKGEPKKKWEITNAGRGLAQYLDVGKKHSDGTPVRQVKWYKNKTLDYINSHNQK